MGAQVDTPFGQLQIISALPESGAFTVKITWLKRPFTLRLRLPDWCTCPTPVSYTHLYLNHKNRLSHQRTACFYSFGMSPIGKEDVYKRQIHYNAVTDDMLNFDETGAELTVSVTLTDRKSVV